MHFEPCTQCNGRAHGQLIATNEHVCPQTDHPAVQLALERARTGSRPGRRTDGCRLGLVVEGGGMRGCVSAGSLMALYQLGLKCAEP